MRLLILCCNYAPELTGTGQMTTDLAEELSARGHELTVATTFPFFPEWRWQEKPPLRRVETLNGVSVRRFRMILPRRRGAAWRITSDTSFAASTLPSALGVRRPDCILAISPPIQLGISAALLAAAWRTRACLYVKDLPLEAAQNVGMMRTGQLLRLGLALERLAYRGIDHIVLLDEIFRANVDAHGVAGSKVSVIPNWVDLQRLGASDPDPELREELGASPTDCLVLHTGNMGEKQDLVNVVEAAARLRDSTTYRFALIGDGMQRQLVEDAIARRRLDNIRVVPLQPAASYGRLLASADVLVLNQGANVIDSVAPHKLLSYMAAGRPVVAAVNAGSVAARLVQAAGCGVLTPPNEPDSLAEAIRGLADSTARRLMLGREGRAYVEQRFDRRRLLDRWEALLTSLHRGDGDRLGEAESSFFPVEGGSATRVEDLESRSQGRGRTG
jgi:colanic acid biosynthesis glycosyl transferase WcaI